MRKQLIIIGVAMFALAGCGGRNVIPMNSGSQALRHASGPVKPNVVQTGKTPVQWTQFNWGDTLNNPAGGEGIVTGPDKNMWYTDYSGAALIKMTMAGKTHAYPLKYNTSTPFNAQAIAVGADGKFYITAYLPYIGVATTSGSFTAIPIPSGDYAGDSAALGSDGNVWFIEQSHVANVSPAGVVTEYSFNDNGSGYSLTAGPDGDIWVVEYGGVIDDVDPSTGEMTSYKMLCSGNGVVSAGDGNLYASCSGNLLRITTSGTMTMIPTGFSATTNPPGLTTGPDGNPWFVDQSGNDIGKYDIASNTLQIYFPPTSYSSDYALAPGPDGNLWALDSTGKTDVYIVNVLSVNPAKVTITGAGHTKTVVVTENGTTAWTAVSSNNAVATVSQGSPSNKFVIKSVAHGSATVTVSDAIGNSFAVKVTVQ